MDRAVPARSASCGRERSERGVRSDACSHVGTRRPAARAVRSLRCGLLFLLVAPLRAQDEEPAAPVPWERRPTVVRLAVLLPPAARRDGDELHTRIADLLWQTYGARWSVAPVGVPLDRADRFGLARLPDDALAAAAGGADLLFVVTLSPGAGGPHVAARGYDASRRVASAVVAADAAGRDAAAAAAVGLIRRLYRPAIRVEPVDAATAALLPRAAELPVRDPSADPLPAGGLLAPYLRLSDRDGVLREVRPIPWTYLRVTDPADPTGDPWNPRFAAGAEVISALRSALPTVRGGQGEIRAEPLPALHPATELTLLARGANGRPLVGYEVLVADRRVINPAVPEGGEPPPPGPEPLRLVSDRRGRVSVPAGGPHAGGGRLVWLHVRSGSATLARLPFVPGAEPAVSLELDNDRLRLEMEAELALLGGDLTDTVARRAVLAARAKNRAKAGDELEARSLLKELAALPGGRDFRRRLDALSAGVLDRAGRANDPLTAARVRRLAGEFRKLIDGYLAADPVAAVREEVSELLRLNADDRAAARGPR